MFDKDLIFLDKDFKNSDQIFEFAFNEFYKRNYVKNTFLEAIKNREKEFPTGLEGIDMNFAIPHTDVYHINKEKIMYISLKNDVIFKYMADSNIDLKVKIVILLAVKDKQKQVPILMKLMETIPKEGFLNNLVKLKDKEKVYNQLINIFK